MRSQDLTDLQTWTAVKAAGSVKGRLAGPVQGGRIIAEYLLQVLQVQHPLADTNR